mmetsp:Transcript_42143/g.127859  ORF Transcript_42143/g.127859 Transcript_42143/m.127859 type:complete len:81 (-) Transcript_42143:2-244(-)
MRLVRAAVGRMARGAAKGDTIVEISSSADTVGTETTESAATIMKSNRRCQLDVSPRASRVFFIMAHTLCVEQHGVDATVV